MKIEYRKAESIESSHLFEPLHRKLIDLLKALTIKEWHSTTICAGWNVKDVAAHMLDTSLRRISMERDGYFSPDGRTSFTSNEDLVHYLNQLNHEWVIAARRISPPLLVAFMDEIGTLHAQHFKNLDPNARAIFAVSWAGEQESLNWFDTAREYSEKWLHQQQIRLALNKQDIMTRELYYPVLDVFMRALPHTYRNIEAAEGTVIHIKITGNAGGSWYLVRENTTWHLAKEVNTTALTAAMATAEIDQSDAWKIFSKGIKGGEARKCVRIQGDENLGSKISQMISVVA